jgi:retrotransposon gag protein
MSNVMATPYLRVIYTLSLMCEDNIKDWVRDQLNELNNQLNNQCIAQDEEEHWNQFLTAFNHTFTDIAAQATTYHKLQDLHMYKDDLDSYIATFNHLATRVGFGREAAATIDKFAKGLKYDLVNKILSHDNIPETMDRWIDAAQKEQ